MSNNLLNVIARAALDGSCISIKPGHNEHWIVVNVSREEISAESIICKSHFSLNELEDQIAQSIIDGISNVSGDKS